MSWQPFTPEPVVNTAPAYACDGTLLYAIGGSGVSGIVDTLASYDPAADTWSTLHALPGPMYYGAAAYLGGLIYFAGGYNASSVEQDSVLVYDPSNDAAGWTALHTLPFTAIDHSLAGFNGKLYITTETVGVDVYEYDPTNDAAGWSALTSPVPTSFSNGRLTSTATELYLVGGQDASFNELRTFYSWDSGAGWTTLHVLPVDTADAAVAIADDGRLYSSSFSDPGVYSYDPADDAAGWRTESSLPSSGGSPSLHTIGDFLYFLAPGEAFKKAATLSGRFYPDPVIGSTVVTASMAPILDFHPDLVTGFTVVTASMGGAPTDFHPDLVAGTTAVTASMAPILSFHPDLVAGRTTVAVYSGNVVSFIPETVYGQTTVEASMAFKDHFHPDLVAGSTTVHIAGDRSFHPDTVRGSTVVTVDAVVIGIKKFHPDHVIGYTLVRVMVRPDLSSNTPILLALTAHARLESIDPLVSA
jgi:hypothetical protein